MFDLMAALVIAAGAPDARKAAALCEVGHVALRDLPSINHNPRFDAYYAGVDTQHHDLLEVCPSLLKYVPPGYPIADDDARARAAIHAPKLGKQPREAFIYEIDVPQISDDLKTATVRMSYSCTGLCGAEFEARYVKTSAGWRREGEIRTLSVS